MLIKCCLECLFARTTRVLQRVVACSDRTPRGITRKHLAKKLGTVPSHVDFCSSAYSKGDSVTQATVQTSCRNPAKITFIQVFWEVYKAILVKLYVGMSHLIRIDITRLSFSFLAQNYFKLKVNCTVRRYKCTISMKYINKYRSSRKYLICDDSLTHWLICIRQQRSFVLYCRRIIIGWN